MNSTILLALIIAWAAVYAMKTIMVQLVKRGGKSTPSPPVK
jgi:hypothetical protein